MVIQRPDVSWPVCFLRDPRIVILSSILLKPQTFQSVLSRSNRLFLGLVPGFLTGTCQQWKAFPRYLVVLMALFADRLIALPIPGLRTAF